MIELEFVMRTSDRTIWRCDGYLLYESLSGTGWLISDDSGWRDGEWPTAEAAIESTKSDVEEVVKNG